MSLYQNYAIAPDSAQSLDQSVAALALKSGVPSRQVIQLLSQGVFTQQQTHLLSPEEKQAALPKLLQYAQAIVEAAQRQHFVEYASVVTGRTWSYPDLFREHISSDLAAIQLDQKVAAAGLKAGESAEAIAALLQHRPYAQFQRDMKQVQGGAIEQYAKGTVKVRVGADGKLKLQQPDQLANQIMMHFRFELAMDYSLRADVIFGEILPS